MHVRRNEEGVTGSRAWHPKTTGSNSKIQDYFLPTFPLQRGIVPGTTRPVTMEHAILRRICPRIGIFPTLCPGFCPAERDIDQIWLRIAFSHPASATKLNFELEVLVSALEAVANMTNMPTSGMTCWLLICDRVVWRLCKRMLRFRKASRTSGADVCVA
jgi:hypothetical protein